MQFQSNTASVAGSRPEDNEQNFKLAPGHWLVLCLAKCLEACVSPLFGFTLFSPRLGCLSVVSVCSAEVRKLILMDVSTFLASGRPWAVAMEPAKGGMFG